MIRSLYTTNRNMNVLQKKLENSGANIANVKTPGYKFQKILQSTLPAEDMINYQDGPYLNRKQDLGDFTFGNQIDGLYRNFEVGNMMETGLDTDFMIAGDGFFSIQLADGQTGYTRNGNFRISGDEILVTAEGHPVLSANGTFISADQVESGNVNFNIVDFQDYDALESYGDTIFLSNQQPAPLGQDMVRQGFIETSNVQIADELVELIKITREFEAGQKIIQSSDSTLEKAVNEIGRV